MCLSTSLVHTELPGCTDCTTHMLRWKWAIMIGCMEQPWATLGSAVATAGLCSKQSNDVMVGGRQTLVTEEEADKWTTSHQRVTPRVLLLLRCRADEIKADLFRTARGEGTWQDCQARVAQEEAAAMFVHVDDVPGAARWGYLVYGHRNVSDLVL